MYVPDHTPLSRIAPIHRALVVHAGSIRKRIHKEPGS
jgi:hypothetical protein